VANRNEHAYIDVLFLDRQAIQHLLSLTGIDAAATQGSPTPKPYPLNSRNCLWLQFALDYAYPEASRANPIKNITDSPSSPKLYITTGRDKETLKKLVDCKIDGSRLLSILTTLGRFVVKRS
jgi:hypothetical protein